MLQSGRSSHRCPTISAQRHKETQSLKSPGLLLTGLLLKVSSLSKKVLHFQKQTLKFQSKIPKKNITVIVMTWIYLELKLLKRNVPGVSL